jgi:hypothetical protein
VNDNDSKLGEKKKEISTKERKKRASEKRRRAEKPKKEERTRNKNKRFIYFIYRGFAGCYEHPCRVL